MLGRSRRRVGAVVTVLALVGSIAVAAPATAMDVPSAPQNLVVTAGPKVGQMVLDWDAAAVGGPLVRYKIGIAADGGAFAAPIVTPNSNTKATVNCAGVVSCDYRVAAVNAAGTGPNSSVTTGTWSVPSAPNVTKVSAGPGANQLTVAWKAPKSTGGQAISAYLYDVQVNSAGSWSGPFVIAGASPGALNQSAPLSCASSARTGCTRRTTSVRVWSATRGRVCTCFRELLRSAVCSRGPRLVPRR